MNRFVEFSAPGSLQFLESVFRAAQPIVEECHEICIHVLGAAAVLELREDRHGFVLRPCRASNRLFRPQPGEIRRHDAGEPVFDERFLEPAGQIQCLRIVGAAEREIRMEIDRLLSAVHRGVEFPPAASYQNFGAGSIGHSPSKA